MTRQETALYIFWIFILLVFTVGGYVIEYQEEKQLKVERYEYRHLYDEDKQKATDDIEAVYKEQIINEIWK